jgi:hypothetical protein
LSIETRARLRRRKVGGCCCGHLPISFSGGVAVNSGTMPFEWELLVEPEKRSIVERSHPVATKARTKCGTSTPLTRSLRRLLCEIRVVRVKNTPNPISFQDQRNGSLSTVSRRNANSTMIWLHTMKSESERLPNASVKTAILECRVQLHSSRADEIRRVFSW